MARRVRHPRLPLLQTRGRFVVLGGIAAFVLVDILLIVLAVHAAGPKPHQSPGPIPTYSAPPSTPSPTDTPAPTDTPSPTPTAEGTTAPAAAVSGGVPLLSAVSATEAWRATSGSCSSDETSTPTPAVVERTTDGGRTWKPVDLGANTVDDALALDAGSNRDMIVGGAGATCTVAGFASYTDGQFWASSSDSAGSAAYVAPSGGSVHLSSGSVEAPCASPQRVVEGATQTAVLCSKTLQVKQGAGSWQSLKLTGLVAIAPTPGAFVVARTGVPGCDGIALQALATPVGPSATPRDLGCAAAPADSAPLTQSSVALASAGSALWLWAGDTTMVSADGGKSW